MFKILRYAILLILASFSLSYASTEFYEQPYSPRTLKLRRPLNFLSLTSVQIASIILDGATSSGTNIPHYGKYRLSPTPFNIGPLKEFLLATDSQDVVILQTKKENKSDLNEITLEIYKWDTEKDLDINFFTFSICKVPQHKSKKKLKKIQI
ncbi:MAG: hypothetical protein BGO76_07130 [Caedibacter sp. 38-128]|nr:hypothetical protein [Holosporales bacterium]OJX04783.1 MAG: hypothetical protein BGO76_07130 [Caedibacter sp. 38-128]